MMLISNLGNANQKKMYKYTFPSLYVLEGWKLSSIICSYVRWMHFQNNWSTITTSQSSKSRNSVLRLCFNCYGWGSKDELEVGLQITGWGRYGWMEIEERQPNKIRNNDTHQQSKVSTAPTPSSASFLEGDNPCRYRDSNVILMVIQSFLKNLFILFIFGCVRS